MPLIAAADGTRLFHRSQGDGPPILFAHEFGGDWHSWDAQVDDLSDRFRCIRYGARGFLPSDVPAKAEHYGQEQSTTDLATLADWLGLQSFHLVGCSMGSYSSLMYAITHRDRLASLTLVGCSSGPGDEDGRKRYREDLRRQIELLDSQGGDGALAWLEADGAYRRLSEKVPAAWCAYKDRLRHQSVEGAQRTLETLHWNRQPLHCFESALRGLTVPTLLVYGEEDHPLVRPTNAYLGDVVPAARVISLPKTGHLVQIEEPELFNAYLSEHVGATA